MSNAQAQLKTTVKPVTTVNTVSHADIAEFIARQIEAPALNYEPIDTSNIDLSAYRSDDSDINKIFTEAGWTNIRLVNELGETIPHGRLIVTHRSGKEYPIVPFFPLVLTANQAKLDLKLESQLKSFSEQGSMKARGSFKFVCTPTQLDAMNEKVRLQYEADTKELIARFLTWLGSYKPTRETLPVVYDAFNTGASLVTLGNDCYIRQVIKTEDASNVQPLSSDNLLLVSSTPDSIGDLILSVCYTFKLVA